jgi:hypothetical protein
VGEQKYATDFEDATPNAPVSASASSTCGGEFVYEGFLVTGDLAPLGALMGNGTTWTGTETDAIVELGLTQDLGKSFVRSITLLNRARTRSEAPEGCPSILFPTPDIPPDLWVIETCMAGDIRFKEGFNTEILVNPGDNSIAIGALVGSGQGEPCDEVPEFSGEAPPPGSSLLSGGPTCNEVLRSVNGIGGRTLRIEGGRGVRVTGVPELFRVNVLVDLADLATC